MELVKIESNNGENNFSEVDAIIKKYEQDFDPSILNVPYREGITDSGVQEPHVHPDGQHGPDFHSHHHSGGRPKTRSDRNWRLFFKNNTSGLRLAILFFLLYHTVALVWLVAPSWQDAMLCWCFQWAVLFLSASTAGTFLYTGLAQTHVFQRK